ncbi:MAG: DUF484 family protein [Halioglobus sp.]|nr:DUF484 family protein [Halioglobus sp.]
MSASKAAAAKANTDKPNDVELSDEVVREFLKDNDDFLQRNPDMLDFLHISHATGSAVSLVEKQVGILRERNIDMRHKLKTLTTNAQDNDKLYEQTSALVLSLLDAQSLDALYGGFMASITRDFDVEHGCMILYGQDTQNDGCRMETPERAKEVIGALFKGNKAVCGTLRQEELKYLFPECSGVGSAAIMPLSGDEPLGLIAVGSSDANRYTSKMGTLFLSHVADVIVRLMPRLQPSEA